MIRRRVKRINERNRRSMADVFDSEVTQCEIIPFSEVIAPPDKDLVKQHDHPRPRIKFLRTDDCLARCALASFNVPTSGAGAHDRTPPALDPSKDCLRNQDKHGSVNVSHRG